MKQKSMTLAVLTLSAFAAVSSRAAVLAEWDTDGFMGDEIIISPTFAITGLTVNQIDLGPQLTTTTGGGGLNTSNWSTELNGALGNYYGFSFTVATDYEVTLTSWELAIRSSGTGPRDFAVRYSGNAFGSNIDTFSTSDTLYSNVIVDLSSLGVLTSGMYEFRVGLASDISSNGLGSVQTGGTHRIMNFDSTSPVAGPTPINLNGSITFIPEPSTALLGGLGFVALLRRRR